MTSAPGGASRPRIRRGLLAFIAALVLVAAAIAVSTTYWPVGEPIPGARVAFDPAAYAAENYTTTIVPAIQSNAVDLPELVTAIAADPNAAGEKYGKRDGSSPWSYSVRASGIAGDPVNGLLPLRVEGVPESTRVAMQIGPAINGTALRDASGAVRFNDFVNQVEYANAATALNQAMAAEVLTAVDARTLAGKTITVVGAATPLNARLFTITPVQIEVGP